MTLELPSTAERREAAMTYALWDSENTTRLEKPDQYDQYLPQARRVLTWLEHRGWYLHAEFTPEDHWEIKRLKKKLRRATYVVSGLSALLILESWRLLT